MRYKKLVSNCNDELMKKIKKVCEIEKRTIANFIRFSCEEKADKILEGVENVAK